MVIRELLDNLDREVAQHNAAIKRLQAMKAEIQGACRAELAGSAFRAWQQALAGAAPPNTIVPEWDHWDEVDQDAWLGMVARTEEEIEQAEASRFETLAGNAYLLFNRLRGEEPLDFFTLPLGLRLAWEAVIRHLVNLLGGFDAQEDGALEGHEDHWQEWARAKAQAAAKPEGEVAEANDPRYEGGKFLGDE